MIPKDLFNNIQSRHLKTYDPLEKFKTISAIITLIFPVTLILIFEKLHICLQALYRKRPYEWKLNLLTVGIAGFL